MSKASEDTVPQSREILQAFVWLGAWTKAFQLRFQNCQAVFLFQWFTLSTFIYHCKYFARQWWPGNWIYNRSCTRTRCQLERCQCYTLVCCIIIEAFLPTEVKIISIVSAFSVKINKINFTKTSVIIGIISGIYIHCYWLMLVYEHNCKGKGANNHPSVKWIKQTRRTSSSIFHRFGLLFLFFFFFAFIQ